MTRILALLLALAGAAASAQPVYKWTDAEGVVHYGDRPPADTKTESLELEPPSPEAASWQPPPAQAASANQPAQPVARQSLNIVMYGRRDCGYCAKARRYFAQRGIGYRELDVERSAQAKAQWKRLGGNGVPLFVINGQVSSGFTADGMTRRLRRYGW